MRHVDHIDEPKAWPLSTIQESRGGGGELGKNGGGLI